MKEWTGQLDDQKYVVRLLTLDDLENVLSIQGAVIEQLENKEFLFPTSRGEFESSITHELMVGVFIKKQLVAFRALAIPIIDEEHLGLDIGLKKEQLHQVIYQDVSMVLPEYRGYGLQQILSAIVMELVNPSVYTHVCATVAPFNIPSLKDKFRQGMVIGAMKMKYKQKLRYVFYKALQDDRKKTTNRFDIPMGDLQVQQEYLSRGWVGTGMVQKKDGWYIVYEERENLL